MFPDLGEFRLVNKILENSAPLEEKGPVFRSWVPVGDDAAIFDGWLATKDLSVEGVHFSLDWSTPEQAVEKHIVSNVSDISAMGGRPRLALFGLCVNKHWSVEVRERVAKAVAEGFAKRGIALVGGDTVSGEVGMFSTTLLGCQVGDGVLLRTAAEPGDDICVSGTLGKSAAGLWLLMNHPEDKDKFPSLVEYHLNPRIKEDFGAKLVRMGVRGAAMDISDGLSSELNHLALSSGVSMVIEEDLLPVDPEVRRMSEYYNIDFMPFVLNGGEEYQLLFTLPQKKDIFQNGLKTCDVYRVGSVLTGSQVYMQMHDGSRCIVKAQAWSHL
mgnify:CR=1 FL=1